MTKELFSINKNKNFAHRCISCEIEMAEAETVKPEFDIKVKSIEHTLLPLVKQASKF